MNAIALFRRGYVEWKFVSWALRTADGATRRRLLDDFASLRDGPSLPAAPPPELTAHGVVTAELRRDVHRARSARSLRRVWVCSVDTTAQSANAVASGWAMLVATATRDHMR